MAPRAILKFYNSFLFVVLCFYWTLWGGGGGGGGSLETVFTNQTFRQKGGAPETDLKPAYEQPAPYL